MNHMMWVWVGGGRMHMCASYDVGVDVGVCLCVSSLCLLSLFSLSAFLCSRVTCVILHAVCDMMSVMCCV